MTTRLLQKKRTGLLMQAVAVLLLAVFVLLVCMIYFNRSLGWFTQNKDVNGSGMNVRIEGVQAEAEYTVYIFDSKENGVRYTNDGRDDKDPKINEFDMQVHDVVFRSRNRYTPALVHVRLSNIQEDMRNGGTATITLTRNGDDAYTVDNNGKIKIAQNSTSILRFTLINNSGTSWLGTNADPHAAAGETYSNADSALYEKIVKTKNYDDVSPLDIDSKVFTTVTKDGNNKITNVEKTSAISLSVNYSAAQASEGILDLFLYITYDEGLVGNFEQAAGIDTSSTSVGKITELGNDLTDLVVRLVH